jgi:beta-N-acetylhexosaminidase
MKDIRRLTLEEKVGQLFFLGFHDFEPDRETQARMDKIRPGGFVFSQRNIESYDQLHALTARFREPYGIPALLAIEHEGGRVDRLKQIFGPVPSLAEMAALGTSYLRAGARLLASELEAVGLNMDLAPMVDLQRPGAIVSARCLSDNPLEVARLASACVEEFSKRNVVAAIKHFPGLGAAHSDPHFTLPRIEKSKKQMLQEDVLPFLNLVDEAPVITVGHAHYPALGDDKPCPASLSPRVVEGFLRKKLGFEGVVITDDLTMGAISSLGLTPEVFLRAIEAGNDMVLFSQATPLVEDGFRLVVRLARANAALRARIEASLERVMRLKSRIQYLPPRHRAHLRSRITRQIERLRSEALSMSES